MLEIIEPCECGNPFLCMEQDEDGICMCLCESCFPEGFGKVANTPCKCSVEPFPIEELAPPRYDEIRTV